MSNFVCSLTAKNTTYATSTTEDCAFKATEGFKGSGKGPLRPLKGSGYVLKPSPSYACSPRQSVESFGVFEVVMQYETHDVRAIRSNKSAKYCQRFVFLGPLRV